MSSFCDTQAGLAYDDEKVGDVSLFYASCRLLTSQRNASGLENLTIDESIDPDNLLKGICEATRHRYTTDNEVKFGEWISTGEGDLKCGPPLYLSFISNRPQATSKNPPVVSSRLDKLLISLSRFASFDSLETNRNIGS